MVLHLSMRHSMEHSMEHSIEHFIEYSIERSIIDCTFDAYYGRQLIIAEVPVQVHLIIYIACLLRVLLVHTAVLSIPTVCATFDGTVDGAFNGALDAYHRAQACAY